MKAWLSSITNVAPLLPRGVSLTANLDAGGQGVVYRGSVSGVPAAVKFYLPGPVETRVKREVTALRQLSCPSIARLLWHGKVRAAGGPIHVVATELVEGESLTRRISLGPLSHNELEILAYDVAKAIQVMWSHRIVHRDLKPDNILLRPSGRSCVIDLGIARHVDDTPLTQTGVGLGTLGYLSPEQSRAVRSLTCHSDIFTLGVILLEGAAGHHPTGRDQGRLLAAGFDRKLVPQVASWTHANLLRTMLSNQPHARPLPATVLQALKAHAP